MRFLRTSIQAVKNYDVPYLTIWAACFLSRKILVCAQEKINIEIFFKSLFQTTTKLNIAIKVISGNQ
jgi:hypothetical protein